MRKTSFWGRAIFPVLLLFVFSLASEAQAAITSKKLFSEVVVTETGAHIVRATYTVIGLTASGANTVPFPFVLPRVPRRVILQSVGNGAVGVIVSLDTSQGVADPTSQFAGGKLGWDATNVYVYIGAGTQMLVTVEY